MTEDIKTSLHERVSISEYSKCPNCNEYKLATIEQFTYSHWIFSIIDVNCLQINGTWDAVRNSCKWCKYREEI